MVSRITSQRLNNIEQKRESISPELIARSIAQAQQQEVKGDRWYSGIEIDESDYDKKGAIFTSYGTGYSIFDKRNKLGLAERTPYGRIFSFKYQGSKVMKVSRGHETSSFCAFKTNSIKEIEWLRSHPLYMIEFFEDTNAAMSVNALLVEIAAREVKKIDTYDQSRLLEKCKAMDIKLGGSLQVMKAELGYRLAKEKFDEEIKKREDMAKNAFEVKHFQKEKETVNN